MNKDTCKTCIHCNPDNIVTDKWLGEIHVCKKGYICEPWNLHNGCKDYKEKLLNKDELKPCPFCGNKDITIKKVSNNAGMDGSYDNWLIKCGVCFAEMNIPADNFYEREYYTEEEAITMWNYRKEETK